MEDVLFMRRCLELAGLGRGTVGCSPLVGAVLVRGSRIIAEGHYSSYGAPHAEKALLDAYKGEITPQDVLYVNLEPCCHSGKTPPCTDAIIASGIRNVVFGMRDPDPRVAGKGIGALQKAKIETMQSALLADCLRVNRGYVTARTRNRPWITLKIAQTKEGKVSEASSHLQITDAHQNLWSHTFLRARHDAILIGVQTVITDHPKLNTRNVRNPPPLLRLILDPDLRIPADAMVVSDALAFHTILVCSPDASEDRAHALMKRGVKIWRISCGKKGFSLPDLLDKCVTPDGDFQGITSILVEGGPATWASFRSAELVDEEITLVGDPAKLQSGSKGRAQNDFACIN